MVLAELLRLYKLMVQYMQIDEGAAIMKKRRVLTILVGLSLILFVVVVLAIVFPSAILRYVFSRIENQTGIALTFDRAYFYLQEGSFLYIDGLTIKRQNHSAGNFDLRADSVNMPAMVPNDFRSPILVITGLNGTYERVGSDPTEESDSFFHALMLINSEIEFIDRTLPEPFQATIKIDKFTVTNTKRRSLLEPYCCMGDGKVSTAAFGVAYAPEGAGRIEMIEVPMTLFAPYAPVLNDIFDSGSMNIFIDDLTDAAQKKLRVQINLLSDCRIKSANQILAPAIQAGLQKMDQFAVPNLVVIKDNIEKLRKFAESERAKLDKVVPIIEQLKFLAPREVREEYEKYKSQYDQAIAAYGKWNAEYDTLLQDLNRVKVNVVEETFQHFITTGLPIEIDVQEVDGEWQYDAYDVVIRLIEKTYRSIILVQFQKRIQDLHDSVGRLLP